MWPCSFTVPSNVRHTVLRKNLGTFIYFSLLGLPIVIIFVQKSLSRNFLDVLRLLPLHHHRKTLGIPLNMNIEEEESKCRLHCLALFIECSLLSTGMDCGALVGSKEYIHF